MTETRKTSAAPRGGSSKYVILGLLVILALGAMMALFVALERQDQANAARVALAAEQRLLARSIAADAAAAVQGSQVDFRGWRSRTVMAQDITQIAAFARLRSTRNRFDEIMALYSGDATVGLPASADTEVQLALEDLQTRWEAVRSPIDTLLDKREPLLQLRQLGPALAATIPALETLADSLANRLAAAGAEPLQLYLATRLVALLRSIGGNLDRLLAGAAVTAAEALRNDIARFDQVLAGLAAGDPQQGLPALADPAARAELDELAGAFATLAQRSSQLLDLTDDLERAQDAAATVLDQAEPLLEDTTQLLEAYTNTQAGFRFQGVPIGREALYALGGLVLLLLILLAFQQVGDSRRQLAETERRQRETEEQNRRNQEAILRLLDEMGDLAEGDLTVQASVTEDITGAIADSINYAIEALRDLVTTINRTSERVASAAQETRGVADRLASSAEVQARQIDTAGKTITDMAKAMDEVSTKTAASSEVAGRSVTTAHEGGERVRRTIQGMDVIREHIQETSKRIKRLGESSQEIGDIVELINDIADQTNILALNAAIQASAAGEAGRGFAVVADEVQRLAERSGNATKRIEALVKTIQADTNEAIISMEKSTTEVVNGASLAEKAGESLNEMENVSGNLAGLTTEISQAASQVSALAARVSATMAAIQEITSQTSESSMATATSIGKLNQLAQELQQSVAGFRLPEQTPGQA